MGSSRYNYSWTGSVGALALLSAPHLPKRTRGPDADGLCHSPRPAGETTWDAPAGVMVPLAPLSPARLEVYEKERQA
jgi:hypothetical protein